MIKLTKSSKNSPTKDKGQGSYIIHQKNLPAASAGLAEGALSLP
jgi:hypothetical protein